MLRTAAHEGFLRDIVLIYSNRRPEDAAFLPELLQLARTHPRFRLVATMTDLATSTRAWDGPKGMVDAALIREATAALVAPIHYVVGPPAMVEAMRATLDGMSDFCAILRATPPADPDKPVLVPGDIEIAKLQRHQREGVVLEPGLREKLEAIAAA